MSEIPSLKPQHREEVLELSRQHSLNFEAVLEAGIQDGSVHFEIMLLWVLWYGL